MSTLQGFCGFQVNKYLQQHKTKKSPRRQINKQYESGKENVEIKETCLFRIRETDVCFGFGVLEICYMSVSAGAHSMAFFTLPLHGLGDLAGFLFQTQVLK